MLFSATQTRKIEDLARLSLKKEPLYVGVDDTKDKATVEGLEQVCSQLSPFLGTLCRSFIINHGYFSDWVNIYYSSSTYDWDVADLCWERDPL